MAAGEYVSVHSQADTENADLARERAELKADPAAETRELTAIYAARGLEPGLARQVAAQLMAHDALGAHARDELGISETLSARPVQAALASAASFAVGAALPLAVALVVPHSALIPWVAGSSLLFLATLGGVAARTGARLCWQVRGGSASGARWPWQSPPASAPCLAPWSEAVAWRPSRPQARSRKGWASAGQGLAKNACVMSGLTSSMRAGFHFGV